MQSTQPMKSTAGLAGDATRELVDLVKAEIDVAKTELRGVIGAELLIGSVIVAGRKHPLALALLGLGFTGAAVGLGGLALSAMPDVLARTRQRVAEDVSRIESSVEEAQP